MTLLVVSERHSVILLAFRAVWQQQVDFVQVKMLHDVFDGLETLHIGKHKTNK